MLSNITGEAGSARLTVGRTSPRPPPRTASSTLRWALASTNRRRRVSESGSSGSQPWVR